MLDNTDLRKKTIVVPGGKKESDRYVLAGVNSY
jgi:hypothetical protein